MRRIDYPICPICGGRIAAAMMTSGAIRNIEVYNTISPWYNDLYYHPSALSIYCSNANCNYDVLLQDLKTPIPKE
jgi:uncharacterized protein (DUF2225 family)